jgi:hypothetical protein
MYPHRMRLLGPWECEPLSGGRKPLSGGCQPPEGALRGLTPPARRVTMPCRWRDCGLDDFAGVVRFLRRFGYPGRIDDHERVWLTFAGVEGRADVSLNGAPLGRREGSEGPGEFEVTRLLQERNLLQVDIEAAGGDAGLFGEVALEVRCTAFLQGLRLWATLNGETARLHVGGEVVGTADRPLDLYVLLDNATVAYAVVEASPDGKPFDVTSEDLPPERWRTRETHAVRVDLVNGATIWHAEEGTFAFQRGTT